MIVAPTAHCLPHCGRNPLCCGCNRDGAGANGYGTLINSCAGCLGEFACVVFLLGGLGPTPYQFLIASCSCRTHDFSATMPVFTCSLCDRIVREARSYHCPHCDYVVCTDCAHRFRAELSLREE